MSNLKDNIEKLLNGKVIEKGMLKVIKEEFNVPNYVLENLIIRGSEGSTLEKEETIKEVKRTINEKIVQTFEAEKINFKIRESPNSTWIIDKVQVSLNRKRDVYEATLLNLGISGVSIDLELIRGNDNMLINGIWCLASIAYQPDMEGGPYVIKELTPLQHSTIDMDQLRQIRSLHTKEQWIDLLLTSQGIEPEELSDREKIHLITRMVPLIENNYNLLELGPSNTGKSYLYRQSQGSVLISGGSATVAKLFVNLTTNSQGMIGRRDCIALDEITSLPIRDKNWIQIMKDYMANRTFSRCNDEKTASTSLVLIGNINRPIDQILKDSHLFDSFPKPLSNDTAFFDRIHCFIPGWEIKKFGPKHFTNKYGFTSDFLGEFTRAMSKITYVDCIDQYFKLGTKLNQRDDTAVRKTVSGLVKLIHPDGNYDKEDVKELLVCAIEGRRRVKEQLKRINEKEFKDTDLSFIDKDTLVEYYVDIPELPLQKDNIFQQHNVSGY